MNAPRRGSSLHAAMVVLAAVALALAPAIAQACPVCGGGNPANRFAFFASTITLSLIPLGLFGVSFLWLRKRIHERAGDEFRERDDAISTVQGKRPR